MRLYTVMTFIAVFLLGVACACTPASAPTNPDASDAALPVPASAACASACDALQALGCPEGEPLGPCLAAMGDLTSHPTLHRSPNGYPLTCQAIAVVTSVASARSIGVLCGGDAEPP